MRIRTYGWVAAVGLAAGTLVYVVSCVNSQTVDTTCPNYCMSIAQTCTGQNAQYPSDNNVTCMNVCAAMQAGTPGVGGANTVACRALSVANAQDDTSAAAIFNDCVNGGVSAANCPTDQCTAFCTLDLALCISPDGGSLAGYTSVSDCVSACQTWDQTPFAPPLVLANPPFEAANTLECRTYHLELSQSGLSGALETHCAHTALVSARCFDTDGGVDGGSDAANDGPSDAQSDDGPSE
jgi:hypothetical protein